MHQLPLTNHYIKQSRMLSLQVPGVPRSTPTYPLRPASSTSGQKETKHHENRFQPS